MAENTGDFGKDFLWGSATASYQVEGAVSADGRSSSIWDTFSRTPGRVKQGHTGEVACDQYHRYPEDIALMREMGMGAYRFSIAWPRLFPEKTTTGVRPNSKGLDYYNRLIDGLLTAGIKPVVTVYHWDLPQYLEDAGGWPVRDTAFRYAEFAESCFAAFSDRVEMFITLNEPWCSSVLGYLVGMHAPGRSSRPEAYRAIHHLLLGHGLAVEAYRAAHTGGKIGITLNMSTPRPATRREEDVAAADRAADLQTRMFMDPLFGRGYPQRHLAAYPEVNMPVEGNDFEKIAQPMDFLGVNFYTEGAVAHDAGHPEGFRSVPTHYPKTSTGWDVNPAGLLRHLQWIDANYPAIPLYITENGCALDDHLSADGMGCHDPGRIEYLREHFAACREAIARGVDLRGYFVWSLIDNFEWAEGFTQRFGIVYCDYVDQRRIPKDSFYYLREVIAGSEQ